MVSIKRNTAELTDFLRETPPKLLQTALVLPAVDFGITGRLDNNNPSCLNSMSKYIHSLSIYISLFDFHIIYWNKYTGAFLNLPLVPSMWYAPNKC